MSKERRTIDKLRLVNFTAFKDLTMEFSPGINAIIGENATGKTHVLKALYFFCSVKNTNGKPANFDISEYFYSTYHLAKRWNLVNRESDNNKATYSINTTSGDCTGSYTDIGIVSNLSYDTTAQVSSRLANPIQGVFIPAKDIISHSKWFVATWSNQKLYFEKHYVDLLNHLGQGPQKSLSNDIENVQSAIERIIGGKVINLDDVYHVVSDKDDRRLEMTFVAEGWRKLAMLWLLLDRGAIRENSILYWDEPEANLNPKLIKEAVRIMLMLERMGVQVFFTTHDYVTLKWLDLLATEDNNVRYHALFRDEEGVIHTESSSELTGLKQNAILDVYEELYNAELEKSIDRIEDD